MKGVISTLFARWQKTAAPAYDARTVASNAYIALIAQARNPFFYKACAVPDTLDGRFEMIVLHLFLFSRRLKEEAQGNASAQLWQQLLELFFADMDQNLRQIGVGDLGVSRRIRHMSEALFGRMAAYEKSLGDTTALREALGRNVYGKEAAPPEALALLIRYVTDSVAALKAQPEDAVLQGELRWGTV